MIYYVPVLAVTIGILLFLRKIELKARGRKTVLYIVCVFLQFAIVLCGLSLVENLIFNPDNREEWLNSYLSYQSLLLTCIIGFRQIDYVESKKKTKKKQIRGKVSEQQFYVFDEHTDYEKPCIKLGMKPYAMKGDIPISFLRGEEEYVVLGHRECYSGWEHTIMKLPKMNFTELYELALHTKIYDERVGALGIILKFHQSDFVDSFTKVVEGITPVDSSIKKIAKLITREIRERSEYVDEMKTLLKLCDKVSSLT